MPVMNKDGSVDETIAMDWDSYTSTMHTTTTKGGIPGVPPGTPEGFVRAQQEMWGTASSDGNRDAVGREKTEGNGKGKGKVF